MATDVLIEVDNRGRLSLGKELGRPSQRFYLAHDEPDGTVVLVPAVVMSESQARLEANPELMAQMERVFSDPSARVRRGRLRRKNLDDA